MREILGKAKTIRELLKGVKYSIDYYQREYKWQDKQVRELMDDLCGKFLDGYQPGHERTQVADYPHYFLGSIIISQKDSGSFIVDGQQRLTSLTLLLVFLRNLQKDRPIQVNVDELIFSEKFGKRSFNINVDERIPLMELLYNGERNIDTNGRPESVQNLVQRYRDIEASFPEEIQNDALPYFMDWLLENVHLVEITAYSDDDAYTIFETMNDRGLSLSNTDMLKGYLLANMEQDKRIGANTRWRERIRALNDAGKDVESYCCKIWLQSKYADKIRERKKGSKPEDYERIGSEFHRWVRDNAEKIGLKRSDDFYRFIDRDFEFFSRQFLRIVNAYESPEPGLEHIFYNGQLGFNLQNLLLLAPIKPEDDPTIIDRKMSLSARYVDILITWRIWNFRSIAHSTMQYNMFRTMKEIRNLDIDELAKKLYEILIKEEEVFASNDSLSIHHQNGYLLHRILARITDYVEVQSGQPSRYVELIAEGANRYEVEHIWANHWEQHADEFTHSADFAQLRDRIGDLLLVPKKFNASYGDLTYAEKLPHYLSQNLLARSLHKQCYEHNPGFEQFVTSSGLPFQEHPEFKKDDIEKRSLLYRKIAEKIWNPEDLLKGIV